MFRFVLLVLLAAPVRPSTNSTLSPIVIVPGLGGSVLEAKIDGSPPYRDCATQSDWYTLWASLLQLTRYDCFNRNIELVLNGTGRVSSATGVSIRPRDFGGVDGIKYSNAGTSEPPLPYMAKMVASLEAAGFVADVSLRAATNDFRGVGTPDVLSQQYSRLKALIEETAGLNGGRAVTLISHSLGGPYTTLFLNEAPAAWKAQYIESFISLSSPVMGTAVTLEGIISGPMYDWIPQFVPELLVPSIRTFPSMLWMMPRVADGANVWGENFTFVSTPTTNYTLSSLRDLVDAVNATVLAGVWEATMARISASATDPGVKVLCIYANDTHTDLAIQMSDDKFDGKGTRVASTMGDGTVNLQSLEACGRWKNVTVRPVLFGGSLAAHTEIVRDDEVIQMIIDQTMGARS